MHVICYFIAGPLWLALAELIYVEVGGHRVLLAVRVR